MRLKIGGKKVSEVWANYIQERKSNLDQDVDYSHTQCKLLGGVWTGANILDAKFVTKWELLFAIAGRQWFAQKSFSMPTTSKTTYELKLSKVIFLCHECAADVGFCGASILFVDRWMDS